jgi:hypothetical protein
MKTFYNAISNGDIAYLENNKSLIRTNHESDTFDQGACWCGCPEFCSVFSELTNPPVYSFGDESSLKEKQVQYFKSVSYLVENGVIDPNHIVTLKEYAESKKSCILAELLKSYAGWEFQQKMILYFLEKTSQETICNFRNEANASMLQIFLICHSYNDSTAKKSSNTTFCINVRDRLLSTNIDMNNITTYCDIPCSTLYNAVNVSSPYLVKLCCAAKADPNLICSDKEYDTLENMVMTRLYRSRYWHNQVYIDEIAEILENLINAGLNLNYVTSDKRNISDYCIQHGFVETSIEKVLTRFGAPLPTGNVYAGKSAPHDAYRARCIAKAKKNNDEGALKEWQDIYENHEIVQMLFQNRFEKNQDKLQVVYDCFKQMTTSDLLLDKTNSTLWNSYIGHYHWHCTPVGEHYDSLKELCA